MLDKEGIAIVNGTVSLISEASIPLSDRGFLFGHSVFETFLVQAGKLCGWQEHYARLLHSCARAEIIPPLEETLKNLTHTAIAENIKLKKRVAPRATLRVIVTAGTAPDMSLLNKTEVPHIILFCKDLEKLPSTNAPLSVALKSFHDTRNKTLIDIKSCNYLFNILCSTQARQQKYDDALFYNDNNLYTEGTTFNFIWYTDTNCVFSAPFENNCLAGTTLIQLIDALQHTDIKFMWKALSKEDLPFIVGGAILSSNRLIVPVRQIDNTYFNTELTQEFFATLTTLLQQRLNT